MSAMIVGIPSTRKNIPKISMSSPLVDLLLQYRRFDSLTPFWELKANYIGQRYICEQWYSSGAKTVKQPN
jgi:hypothetical protein